MATDDAFSVDVFVAHPRVAGLAISPDGERLVTTVATPSPDGKEYRTALYALDPEGQEAPQRLTNSATGESVPVFLPSGDLLFTSKRPDPDRTDNADDRASGLWLLPSGGEARLVADPPGGVSAVAVAHDAGIIAVSTGLHPSADTWEADAERTSARKDAGVNAQLFTSFPVRFWDRWIGPRRTGLFAAATADDDWVALTPDLQDNPFERATFGLTPDGATLVTSRWQTPDDIRDRATDLIAIDIADGAGSPRVLASESRVMFGAPVCSPDGTVVACLRSKLGTPETPPDTTLVLVPVDGSSPPVDVLEGFDRWPQSPTWSPDGQVLYFTADDEGHCLPFRLDVETRTVTRLASHGAYTDLVLGPDGTSLYALRSSPHEAPHVVALDPTAADQEPRRIPSPGDGVAGPGRMERVTTTAADGTEVPGWLVLPPGDEPAPLAVFIHGGPLSSWNAWTWRWCPGVLAARGWAVLLPDPALSTGYGQAYVARGRGRWGAEPYTDIISLVDAVEARDDIDETRTAALGGSFGGYMANWVAGHTDRFDAIVTHASLWNLEAFHGTTDMGPWWENEFGDRYTSPERYREWSPHQFVDRITTPMLVIHGEKDYRVPVSEGVSLWTDLKRHGVDATYLHFPDENHWVLTPQHATIWYETVIAFLEHRVLGKPWDPPALLG